MWKSIERSASKIWSAMHPPSTSGMYARTARSSPAQQFKANVQAPREGRFCSSIKAAAASNGRSGRRSAFAWIAVTSGAEVQSLDAQLLPADAIDLGV